MRLIAEYTIPKIECGYYVQGEIANTHMRLRRPNYLHGHHYHTYVSMHNPGDAQSYLPRDRHLPPPACFAHLR